MADAVSLTPSAPGAVIAETPAAGLTSAQVAERRSRGLANAGGERTSRSVAEILRANILTRFNFILGVLLAVILVAGQPQDALFGVVLVTNALIGIAQELRAKRTLDRLAVLSAPRVRVIRDGAPRDIAVADLVAGNLVDLRAGDQLVADGVVRAIARTMGVVTFSLLNLFFSIEAKDERQSAFSLDTFSDRTFIMTTGLSFFLLVMSTVLRPFQTILKTTTLDVRQWLICTAVALSIIVAAEIRKAVRRRTAAKVTTADQPAPRPAATAT